MSLITEERVAESLTFPKDENEQAQLMLYLADLLLERASVETTMNEQIAALKKEGETKIARIKDRIDQTSNAIRSFAELNKKQFTRNGKRRTVQLRSGTFKWNRETFAVVAKNASAVARNLWDLRLRRFVRLKYELKKDRIKQESAFIRRRKIPNLFIQRHQTFSITPTGVPYTVRYDVEQPGPWEIVPHPKEK